MNIFSTDKALDVIGPYSQEYEIDGVVYTSGQIPVSPAGGTVAEGIVVQAEQNYKNVGAVLEAAGTGFDRVPKTACFLTDMNDFGISNEMYIRYFVSKPARSCVAVKALPKDMPCKVEVIAVE